MLKNYIKIAFRNINRNKGFSFINIFGLAIGIACCILLSLYVVDELSYDAYHKNSDQIYRVAKTRIAGGNEYNSVWSSPPMGPAVENSFPEVKESIRFWRAFGSVVGYNDTYFNEDHLYFADPEVFETFSFELSVGNPTNVLTNHGSVVLSSSVAEKYFGNQDPIGKSISYNGYPGDEIELTVTGIMEELPSNSQFKFNILATMEGIETEAGNWGSQKPIWTYLLLQNETDPEALEKKLPSFLDGHYSSSAVTENVELEPLKSVHLYSSYSGGFKTGGNITYVYLFSAIGLFILIIACINFMNLATARALERAGEVGVRKTLGAPRNQLIKQFLGEALIISALAMFFGILFAELALPILNNLAEKSISLPFYESYWFPGSLVLLWLIVGLLSGLYPAFFLSGFKPIRVLGNKYVKDTSGEMLRKGLVVFQFAVTVVLIIATLTIYNQMEYIQNKNLGFDKEQVIAVPYTENEKALLNLLNQNPDVIQSSVSQRVPVNETNSDGRTISLPDREEPIRVESYIIDENFLSTYKINLIAGRNLSEELASDSSSFLINESAVHEFGWSTPQEAIGKTVTWSSYKPGKIIGVVEDFHMGSFYENIEPLVMHTVRDRTWWRTFISVRVRPDNVSETLSFLESIWKELTPVGAYEYFFIDQSIEQLHRNDQRTGRIFSYFAGLAILISCLGLFGLASFMARKREKEIGIRKVFGAELSNILYLLSIDFLKLIAISFMVAIPIAYISMQNWLQSFAYSINVNAGIFILAGIIVVMITLFTISYQSTKVALVNPVKSLRSE